jgi:hypothetical protein
MGTVINLFERQPDTRARDNIERSARSATVVILPVIRIERYADNPAKGIASRARTTPVRRRRRRVSRS